MFDNSDSAVVNRVEIEALGAVKAPEIFVAIWAELLNKVPANSVSAVVNLVEIEALGTVNAPVIAVAIWAELLNNVFPFNVFILFKFVVIFVAIEELVIVKAPEIFVAI